MLDPNCQICKAVLDSQKDGQPLNEKYNYFGSMAIYDIDAAKKIVADGRYCFHCETERLANFVSYTGEENKIRALATFVCGTHIDHVSDSEDDPIILGWGLKPRKGETYSRGQMPIDGHHRIARAIKYKQPFVYLYVLSQEENDSIIDRKSTRLNSSH